MRKPVLGEFDIQPLESRVMFAAAVASAISITSSALGNILVVSGTSRDDTITITNLAGKLQIANGTGWSTLYTGAIAAIKVIGNAGNDRITIDPSVRTDTMLFGGSGADTLSGGGGNDKLYAGDGRDSLSGNAGNDTLVSIGNGANDRLSGGTGLDSFWCDTGAGELILDATADETSTIHRVGSFLSGTFGSVTLNAPTWLAGQNLADPTLTSDANSYQNFSDRPLFSKNGPSLDDIYQGQLGDCYLLASLGSVAKANQQVIRNSLVELGDGTYAVQFTDGANKVFVRVDGDLPMNAWGLAYANFGKQQSIWAALIEKAYAFFRYRQGSYDSLEGGFMGDVYSHMGLSNSSTFSGKGLLDQIAADLAAGKAVTFGTKPDVGDAPITGGHAYTVDAVIKDAIGNITGVRFRNPWGIDDAPGYGANDGYIYLTVAQVTQSFWFCCSAIAR